MFRDARDAVQRSRLLTRTGCKAINDDWLREAAGLFAPSL